MQRKSLISILAVAGGALVLVVALVIASQVTGKKPSSTKIDLGMAASTNEMLSGIPQQGVALGNPKAKLTLIEFADLQCSACADFSANTLPQLIQDFVRTGKVRIEFQGQTLIDTFRKGSEDSNRLLRMALAAGEQNKLWQFAEIVYSNQGGEDSGYATDSYLTAVANAIPGLDVPKAVAARDASQFTSAIKASKSRWKAAGYNGTPAFLLGPTGKRPAIKIARYDEVASNIRAALIS